MKMSQSVRPCLSSPQGPGRLPGIIQRWTLNNDFLNWPLVAYCKTTVTFYYCVNGKNQKKVESVKNFAILNIKEKL